jgi:hypothetical protein
MKTLYESLFDIDKNIDNVLLIGNCYKFSHVSVMQSEMDPRWIKHEPYFDYLRDYPLQKDYDDLTHIFVEYDDRDRWCKSKSAIMLVNIILNQSIDILDDIHKFIKMIGKYEARGYSVDIDKENNRNFRIKFEDRHGRDEWGDIYFYFEKKTT